MKRRSLITALAATALVAACAQKQLVEPGSVTAMRVTDVNVVLTAGPKRSAEFYELAEAQVTEALETATLASFAQKNPTGTQAVTANVTVNRMIIANPGVGALIGQKTSLMIADIAIVDPATGAALAAAPKVNGKTKPRPTMAGTLFIRSPEGELARVAENFAKRAAIAVFGE